MAWIPHITVAAVIARRRKFLLVKEEVEGIHVYNQPAGHLEENESLTEAVIRETLEESGFIFKPESIVGLYQWQKSNSRTTYLRLAFTGSIEGDDGVPIPDKSIIDKAWLSADELRALPENKLRSSMVLRCVEDYLANKRYPMPIFTYLNDRMEKNRI